MQVGDLVRVKRSGKIGLFVCKVIDDNRKMSERCRVQFINSLVTYEFLCKDLEVINKKL